MENTQKNGTITELDLKQGDVIGSILLNGTTWTKVGERFVSNYGTYLPKTFYIPGMRGVNLNNFYVVSRASENLPFEEMNDAQKGQLLLDIYNQKTIQYKSPLDGKWYHKYFSVDDWGIDPDRIYRVAPEIKDVEETITLGGKEYTAFYRTKDGDIIKETIVVG